MPRALSTRPTPVGGTQMMNSAPGRLSMCLSKLLGVEKFSPQCWQWHLRDGCQPAVQAGEHLWSAAITPRRMHHPSIGGGTNVLRARHIRHAVTIDKVARDSGSPCGDTLPLAGLAAGTVPAMTIHRNPRSGCRSLRRDTRRRYSDLR